MSRIFNLVLSLSCVCLHATTALDCPAGWIGHGVSCYHISHDKEAWIDAQMICQAFGGYLAEIENQLENDFLINELRKSKVANHWLGGNDLSVEGEWKWWHSKEDISYSNWFPGEPSNGGGNANCLSFYTFGSHGIAWNDDHCSNDLNYICEKEPSEGCTFTLWRKY